MRVLLALCFLPSLLTIIISLIGKNRKISQFVSNYLPCGWADELVFTRTYHYGLHVIFKLKPSISFPVITSSNYVVAVDVVSILLVCGLGFYIENRDYPLLFFTSRSFHPSEELQF